MRVIMYKLIITTREYIATGYFDNADSIEKALAPLSRVGPVPIGDIMRHLSYGWLYTARAGYYFRGKPVVSLEVMREAVNPSWEGLTLQARS